MKAAKPNQSGVTIKAMTTPLGRKPLPRRMALPRRITLANSSSQIVVSKLFRYQASRQLKPAVATAARLSTIAGITGITHPHPFAGGFDTGRSGSGRQSGGGGQ